MRASRLGFAAALALAAIGAASIAQQESPRRQHAGPPVPRPRAPRVDSALQREIAEWNERVDSERRLKKAAKGMRRSKRG